MELRVGFIKPDTSGAHFSVKNCFTSANVITSGSAIMLHSYDAYTQIKQHNVTLINFIKHLLLHQFLIKGHNSFEL